MTQSANISVQNNFVKGLITEATALTFPENACTDTDNCVFDHLGLVERRRGFEYEGLAEFVTQDLTDNSVVTYLWTNVGGDGTSTFAVVQIGDTLHFYAVNEDESLSGSKHPDTIDLTAFLVSGVVSVSNLECQFSSGNGRLFVTNQRLETFYVEYDPVGDAITATEITIRVRDFEGDTADTLGVSERPTSTLGALDANHRYNLENQGWTTANLTAWDTARTDMPSNADVSWNFKNATDEFDFTVVDDRLPGNSQAPRGHFIYSVYDFNRSANVSGATDFEIEQERFQTSAFHAGRVFYSGLKVPSHSSRIYFTQVITSPAQYGDCFQVNDPTSETLFDLLPTDGGFIDIIDAGAIIKMVPVLNSLLVFATNGIWTITGSQGIGFSATDYSINRLSSLVNYSHTSFVDVDGIPYWWNLDGIYTVSPDRQTNSLRVQSLTDGTIRSFYLEIPSESKSLVRGAYDPFLKRIHWAYRSETATTFEEKYIFDRFLIFNMLTGAFFKWSIDPTNVRVNSILNILGQRGQLSPVEVYDGDEQVVDGTDEVIVFLPSSPGQSSTIKYFVSRVAPNVVTWAECYDVANRDWFLFDGVGSQYDSYAIAGYAVRGKGISKFQDQYVNFFSKADTSSSFKVQGRWDYASSGNTGRWSSSQLLIVDGGEYAFKAKRVRIRGHGLACQFKIFNNDRNPFKLVGWSVYETGNQKP